MKLPYTPRVSRTLFALTAAAVIAPAPAAIYAAAPRPAHAGPQAIRPATGPADFDGTMTRAALIERIGFDPVKLDGPSAALQRLLERDPGLEYTWEPSRSVPTTVTGDLRDPDARSPFEISADFLYENADLLGLVEPDLELRIDGAHSKLDDLETGWSVVRFEQMLGGYRVIERNVNVHVTAEGAVGALHGRFEPGLDARLLPAGPKLKPSQIEAVVRRDLGWRGGFNHFDAPELVVAVIDGRPVLAFQTLVNAPNQEMDLHYLIDAVDGRVVRREKRGATEYSFYVCMSSGSGTDQFGYSRAVNSCRWYNSSSGYYGNYYLDDAYSDGRIKGYDQNGSSSFSTADPCVDGNNAWTGSSQEPEVAGQYVLGQALEFYGDLGRNSWDNAGGSLQVGYHATFGSSASPNNASASSSGVIKFGDGDGSSWGPWTTLDVAGHELTHAVLFSEGVNGSSNQGNAMHESTGDVMGTLIEYYFGNQHGWTNFKSGEEISLTGSYVRDLSNPSRDHMKEFDSSSSANAHTNGEILNYAAYLAWMGGTHPDSGVSVSGIGETKIRNIYYTAINQYLTGNADPTFLEVRAAVSSAASQVYGSSSSERTSVQNAFTAVGVTTANFGIITNASLYDVYSANSGDVTFGSAYSAPGVGWTAVSLEDGTAAPSSSDSQLGFLPYSSTTGYIMGNYLITLPTVSGSSEPHLKFKVGFRSSAPSTSRALVYVTFIPSDGSSGYIWSKTITKDGIMDTKNEDMSGYAGKTGTLNVLVFNTGSSYPVLTSPVIFDQLQISYE